MRHLYKHASLFLFFVACLGLQSGLAQDNVGIGTTSPNPKALLELKADGAQGFLLPRLQASDTLAFAAGMVDKGLMFYDTVNAKIWFFTGSYWQATPSAGTGGMGLQYFVEAQQTTDSGSVWSPVSGLDQNIVLKPLGLGALSSDTSGDPRGNYAVDLQLNRANPTEVAGGNNSALVGGFNNTVTGFASGAFVGHNNGVSGFRAASIGGRQDSVDGSYSVAIGGQNNKLVGEYTVALGGSQLRTPSFGEIAMGTWNTNYIANNIFAFDPNDRAISVGNGSFGNRSNAMELFKDGRMNLDSTLTIGFDDANGYTLPPVDGTAGQVMATDGTGSVSWQTPTTGISGSGTANRLTYWDSPNSVTASNDLSFDPTNGRLGIGIGVPNHKLQVEGNVGENVIGLFKRLDNTRQVGIQFDPVGAISLSNPRWKMGMWPNSSSFEIQSNDGSTDIPRLSIRDNGNVGIGTRSPSNDLTISKEGAAGVVLSVRNTMTAAAPNPNTGIELISDHASGNTFIDMSSAFAGEDYDFRISSDNDTFSIRHQAHPRIFTANKDDGNVGIGGPSEATYKLRVHGKLRSAGVNETSDRRYKKDIKTLQNALPKVMMLRGVNYKWRQDEYPAMHFADGTELGLIAQEVEEVIPEVVDTDAQGYKSVMYNRLVALLIEAMKEQQDVIDSQDKTIADMQGDLELIKAKLGMEATEGELVEAQK